MMQPHVIEGLEGFGALVRTEPVSEIVYPKEYGKWGHFLWPDPLLGSSSEPAAELLMAVYRVDELGNVAITIITKEKGVSFVRTVPFSGLEGVLNDWRTLLSGVGSSDHGQYDLGTNILEKSIQKDPDTYLRENETPLFRVKTSEAGSSENIRIRGYDTGRVVTAFETIHKYIGRPNGVHGQGQWAKDWLMGKINENGHQI